MLSKEIAVKKNYCVLALYMTIMGAGLYICKNFLGTPYDSPNFSEKFLPFMVTLAVLAGVFWKKNRRELVLKSDSKPGYFLPLVVFIPIVATGIYVIIKGFRPETGFLILLLDTSLIGIAEEGMFRGILLGGLVRRIKPVQAVLVSSLFFSALHGLNIFGGLEASEVVSQMGSTIVMGVFLASMYLYTEKIAFPVVFHSMWDLIILGQNYVKIDSLPLILIGAGVVELAVSALILLKLVRNKTTFGNISGV